MKKSELKSGMMIQTEHNRYGFIELDRNRIHICYDPDCIHDEDQHYEMVSLDDVFEFGDEYLGIGFIVTRELKEKYPECYEDFEVGDICIAYEIVAVYGASIIYDNGIGPHPPLILDDSDET